jgi:ethanolamine utilization protein EutA
MHDDHDEHEHGELGGGVEGPIPKNDFYYADNVELTTVGIDIGSSTSHLMFSHLHLQRLGQYLSSRYVVVERKVLHRSPILLTPYKADYTIDADRLRAFILEAYREGGFTPEDVDTGAIILTGEAIKRTNARAIADLFASQAGKFVCASAGHNLEAILAANGSGAVAVSRHPPQTVMNVDIGGGTCKLALARNGEILETAAINVGGRLVAMDDKGRVVRIEPAAFQVASALGVDLHLDRVLTLKDQRRLAEALADCLVQAMQRGPLSPLAQQLMLTPPLSSTLPIDALVFSGGVSEYVYQQEEQDFGDLARPLAEAVRKHMGDHVLPAPIQPATERIRATVIGASQFTVQVSGNTITVSRPEILPIHNLQVLYPRLPDREEVQPDEMRDAIQKSFQRFDLEEGAQPVALAITWAGMPRYPLLRSLADGIVQGVPKSLAAGMPLVLVFANDCGKLVGEIIRDELGVKNDVISIDSISLKEFDYIDIGDVIYPAHVVPVVVKSLVFPEVHGTRARLLER